MLGPKSGYQKALEVRSGVTLYYMNPILLCSNNANPQISWAIFSLDSK